MNPPIASNRRDRKAQVALESLEGRQLLTGGAGNNIAIMPGNISTAGGTASIKFTIDPKNFTVPHGSFTLGIDVAGNSGTSVKPSIVSVFDQNGHRVQTKHSLYDPHVQRTNTNLGMQTSAVLVPISLPRGDTTTPVTYTVNVTGMQKSSGQFLLGFYLPGDVAGTGTVNQADYNATRSIVNANANTRNYNFYADANRDGRINGTDLSIVRKNMGVSVTISPVVSSNLNPASVNVPNTRNTNDSTVNFTGVATPGATVIYTNDGNGQATSTTANSKGNYSINVGLVSGSNTFTLTTHDSFGQSISGSIQPVTLLA
jgi:hypothetical protein